MGFSRNIPDLHQYTIAEYGPLALEYLAIGLGSPLQSSCFATLQGRYKPGRSRCFRIPPLVSGIPGGVGFGVSTMALLHTHPGLQYRWETRATCHPSYPWQLECLLGLGVREA